MSYLEENAQPGILYSSLSRGAAISNSRYVNLRSFTAGWGGPVEHIGEGPHGCVGSSIRFGSCGAASYPARRRRRRWPWISAQPQL
jgi:hypothetical protein